MHVSIDNGSGQNVPPFPAAPQQNTARGKPFVRGDPRINRAGTISPLTKLQKVAQEALLEVNPAVKEQKETYFETIVREWRTGTWREQKALLEFAFGKPREQVDMSVLVAGAVQVLVPLLIQRLSPEQLSSLRTELRRLIDAS